MSIGLFSIIQWVSVRVFRILVQMFYFGIQVFYGGWIRDMWFFVCGFCRMEMGIIFYLSVYVCLGGDIFG
jgi:hypothetical protein